MSETEAPTEHLHEHIQEGAEHGSRWMVWVALSTAILAVLAAIASLMANHHSDETLLTQIKASDKWSYYEAKSIKSQILNQTNQILESLGKEKNVKDEQKIEANKVEQENIKKEAEEFEEESKKHLEIHEVLARSVTIFQIAIAISAITILTKRKVLWFVSLVFALAGVYFLISGII